MELIGNILKETTRIGYQRQLKTVNTANVQKRTLLKLIKKSKHTAFGAAHDFNEIINDVDFVDRFKQKVAITNYERYHAQWLHRTIDGEKDVIWPGKISYFALSSGTSVGSSKKIPVSEKMLRKFQKASLKQLNGIYSLQLPPNFYTSNLLIVGGSTNLEKMNKSLNGDLSGILAKNRSIVFAPFTKPTSRISKIKEWDEKVEAIIEMAPSWNIGVIAGVPSWVSQLLERIVERYKLETIHDIWPNLKIYIHGGIFLKPYEEKLKSVFGKSMVYQNTYLASEGYFAFEQDFLKSGMQLMLSNGIFYEFVEEKYFDLLDSPVRVDIPTLTINEVRERTPYAMVITTCAGLWRYSLGDTVEFTDVPSRTIRILGRISFYLNDYGEHLSDSNLSMATELLSEKMNSSIEEFTVYSDKENKRHYWYLGVSRPFSESQASILLDDFLKDLNVDYGAVRDHILKPPTVRILPTKTFYRYLHRFGKLGGQNKFPHILNDKQYAEWTKLIEL